MILNGSLVHPLTNMLKCLICCHQLSGWQNYVCSDQFHHQVPIALMFLFQQFPTLKFTINLLESCEFFLSSFLQQTPPPKGQVFNLQCFSFFTSKQFTFQSERQCADDQLSTNQRQSETSLLVLSLSLRGPFERNIPVVIMFILLK